MVTYCLTCTLLAACCCSMQAGAQTNLPAATAMPHYERAGRVIYGYQRLVGILSDDERAQIGQRERRLDEHLAHLTETYRAITALDANVPDAQLDAAWAEIQAVGAELDAWRKEKPPATGATG